MVWDETGGYEEEGEGEISGSREGATAEEGL